MYGNGKPSQAAQSSEQVTRPRGAAVNEPLSARRPADPPAGSLSRGQFTLAEQYHFVIKDLKRLGIIAVSTFALLIILGLIIR
jgi:hypothetical protein